MWSRAIEQAWRKMGRRGDMRWILAVLAQILLLAAAGEPAEAAELGNEMIIKEDKTGDRSLGEEKGEAALQGLADGLGAYINLEEIQLGFQELAGENEFSFSETVLGLLRGEIPFEVERLPELLAEMFLGQLRQQKQMALQVLVIVLASAVFSNFVKIFDSSQIADISFFMMYLLISTLLMRTFLTMSQSVVRTCDALNRFMRLLLPSYLVTVVLSSGTVSAVGFYEITLLGMQLLQTLIIRLVLPAINFYLVLLLLNQMTEEDHFSHFAELVETVIRWATKSIFGIVVGLQAVQVLIAPALDTLKNSAFHRLAKSIPGIGSVLDSAAETVVGSAVVIKNAVGVAGMLALIVISVLPLLKLLASILLFRLLCALIQPVSEKRMVDGIASISRGTVLLLHILATSLSVFVISIAMITAAIRGG